MLADEPGRCDVTYTVTPLYKDGTPHRNPDGTPVEVTARRLRRVTARDLTILPPKPAPEDAR